MLQKIFHPHYKRDANIEINRFCIPSCGITRSWILFFGYCKGGRQIAAGDNFAIGNNSLKKYRALKPNRKSQFQTLYTTYTASDFYKRPVHVLLYRFYPDFIQISSRFLPNSVLILS